MSSTTKHEDRHDVTVTASGDLTGATVRLLARRVGSRETVELPCTITDPANGVVVHRLDGTLPTGTYRVELEATTGDQIVTYPNSGYATLRIDQDLG